MSIIAEKVKTLLQTEEFHPLSLPDNNEMVILTDVQGHNGGQYTIHYVAKDAIDDNQAALLITTQFPIKIPPDKTEKILDFLNRVNHMSWFTWLTLSDGIITSNSGIHSNTNDSLNDDIIKPNLFSVFSRLDVLHPYLIDLIYSEKTVDDLFKKGQKKE